MLQDRLGKKTLTSRFGAKAQRFNTMVLASILIGSFRLFPLKKASRLRIILLRLARVQLSGFVRVFGTQIISSPPNLAIGDGVFINAECVFDSDGGITIGDHTLIGPRVQILTGNHVGTKLEVEHKPVVIGSRVWIGAGAMILPGVHIGDRAVIGAGSVVTRNVPADCRVAGVPARPIQKVSTLSA